MAKVLDLACSVVRKWSDGTRYRAVSSIANGNTGSDPGGGGDRYTLCCPPPSWCFVRILLPILRTLLPRSPQAKGKPTMAKVCVCDALGMDGRGGDGNDTPGDTDDAGVPCCIPPGGCPLFSSWP